MLCLLSRSDYTHMLGVLMDFLSSFIHHGSRVYDINDPRHIGIVKVVSHGDVSTANIQWEETGWWSFRVPLRNLKLAETDQ